MRVTSREEEFKQDAQVSGSGQWAWQAWLLALTCSYSGSSLQGGMVDAWGGLACKERRQTEFGVCWVCPSGCRGLVRSQLYVSSTRELSPMAVRFGISVLFLCVRHIRASKANARYPENSAGNSGLGNSKCQQHSCGEWLSVWGFPGWGSQGKLLSSADAGAALMLPQGREVIPASHSVVIPHVFMWHCNIQEKGI